MRVAASSVIGQDLLHRMLSQLPLGFQGSICRALVREQSARAEVQSPLAAVSLPVSSVCSGRGVERSL